MGSSGAPGAPFSNPTRNCIVMLLIVKACGSPKQIANKIILVVSSCLTPIASVWLDETLNPQHLYSNRTWGVWRACRMKERNHSWTSELKTKVCQTKESTKSWVPIFGRTLFHKPPWKTQLFKLSIFSRPCFFKLRETCSSSSVDRPNSYTCLCSLMQL